VTVWIAIPEPVGENKMDKVVRIGSLLALERIRDIGSLDVTLFQIPTLRARRGVNGSASTSPVDSIPSLWWMISDTGIRVLDRNVVSIDRR
jgi:hypothetical protein